jgi:hypothetical protein
MCAVRNIKNIYIYSAAVVNISIFTNITNIPAMPELGTAQIQLVTHY